MNVRILSAEALGTFVLMIGGVGSAVLAGGEIGFHGVAIAFGFSLLIMAYTIGPISGCHINPAVTLGHDRGREDEDDGRCRRTSSASSLGAAARRPRHLRHRRTASTSSTPTNNFGANGYDEFSPGGYNLVAVAVGRDRPDRALRDRRRRDDPHGLRSPGFGPIAAGLTLALIHLVTIPVSNTSVNPARSIGAAIFAGSDALEQLWAFIVFPLIGGALGVIVTRFVVGAPKPAL